MEGLANTDCLNSMLFSVHETTLKMAKKVHFFVSVSGLDLYWVAYENNLFDEGFHVLFVLWSWRRQLVLQTNAPVCWTVASSLRVCHNVASVARRGYLIWPSCSTIDSSFSKPRDLCGTLVHLFLNNDLRECKHNYCKVLQTRLKSLCRGPAAGWIVSVQEASPFFFI